jgi:hypothetical protein
MGTGGGGIKIKECACVFGTVPDENILVGFIWKNMHC